MNFYCLLLIFVINIIIIKCQWREPTRNKDLWNPNGTTTPHPKETRKDEIFVRLSIGDIIGKKMKLYNLPWNEYRDPSEIVQSDEQNLHPVYNKNNVTIYTFLGLPYAMAPISERRFKPPQQITSMMRDKPYLAFDYKPSCSQDIESRSSVFINRSYPFEVDEDCLYLNIFTPEISKSSTIAYPVIAFFHGGNFQTGSANEWPGHILASRGLVVVTINYRLSAFGFMSLGDKKTGNYGIKDQRLALLWIQQYIGAFGGDPQAVTIIGHDAGAVSAGMHMFTEKSKDLFRGVVAMSGSDVSYHSMIENPGLAYNNTIKLGKYLGCLQLSSQETWDCILQRSSKDITSAISNSKIPIEYNRYMFLPTIGNDELHDNPLNIMKNVVNGYDNIPSKVPYLTGLNKEDGVEVILQDRHIGFYDNDLSITREYQRSFIIEYAFKHNYTLNREATVDAIDDYYTYWPDINNPWNIRQKFIELTTDAYYTEPISLSAHFHSSTGSRTFMYVNNYNFSKTRENMMFKGINPFPSWMGSCHECDLYLLFGFPFMPKEYLPEYMRDVDWFETDKNASQLFGSFIRRFVQMSDPNLPLNGEWLAHQPREHWYMNFNYTYGDSLLDIGELKRDYRYQEVAFWNHYLSSLVSYVSTTLAPWEHREKRDLDSFKIAISILTLIVAIFMILAVFFGYKYSKKKRKFNDILCTRANSRLDSRRQFIRLQEYPSTTNIIQGRGTPTGPHIKLSSL